MSMCSGISAGRVFDLDLAMHEVEHTALDLHAARLAVQADRHLHVDLLGEVDTVEVGVQQLMGDRLQQVGLDDHLLVAPANWRSMRVLSPAF